LYFFVWLIRRRFDLKVGEEIHLDWYGSCSH
jgi:hypothetical protein